MRKQVGLRIEVREFEFPACVSGLLGVPAGDDSREQVEPCDPEVPCSGRPVPDLSLAPDPQRAFQRMVRLALVQAETGASPHVDIEQPFDHEQRPFAPSDFAKRDGQVMLARTGRELSQELARPHRPGRHRCHAAHDVGPVGDSRALPDPVADQSRQFGRDALRVEDVKPSGRQVPYVRDIAKELEQKGVMLDLGTAVHLVQDKPCRKDRSLTEKIRPDCNSIQD